MAKVSDALRERLLAQKKSMQRGGMLIRNKDITRMRLRILPPQEGELPGVENTSFYSKTLNKGSTSTMCWGVPDPVSDALDNIYRSGSKDDKETAKTFCRRTVEYWVPVIDRSDEGTPQSPRLRILASKHGVYQRITDWMLDESDGEDITDPVEGRDVIIKRKGVGLETEWSVDKADRSPISDDEELANAWVELAGGFDVRTRFYIPKFDVLEAMYKGLTGERIPATYATPIKELIATLEAGGHVDPDADVDAEAEEVETVETTEAVATEETTETTAEATDDGDLTGQLVQFTNDGAEVQGTVLGPDADEEGLWLVAEDGGDPNEPWSIPVGMLTVIEIVEEETTVAEEVAAPAPKKKTITAAPKAEPAKVTKPVAAAPKPAATKTSIPKPAATTVTAKPGVKTVTAVTKPAAALPRKPVTATPAAAPKASSTIKANLRAKAAAKK